MSWLLSTGGGARASMYLRGERERGREGEKERERERDR
jgi:hypothetical protein